MTLEQMQYFLVLCRELSFTRAAKLCGISQPSMTNAIITLEAELGAPLFHRSPQVRLSELGERLKPVFERIEAAAGEVPLLAVDMKSAERTRPRRRSGSRRRRKSKRSGRLAWSSPPPST